LVNKDGSLGERNGIYCGGLEHKMGIKRQRHGTDRLDGAIGTMVGSPTRACRACS
jgi:hypothetical protein